MTAINCSPVSIRKSKSKETNVVRILPGSLFILNKFLKLSSLFFISTKEIKNAKIRNIKLFSGKDHFEKAVKLEGLENTFGRIQRKKINKLRVISKKK
ncbi:MAG: hypothetical protein K6F15_07645 [Treponema sp.]|nr:hypothetical protein [Treponema sp.]